MTGVFHTLKYIIYISFSEPGARRRHTLFNGAQTRRSVVQDWAYFHQIGHIHHIFQQLHQCQYLTSKAKNFGTASLHEDIRRYNTIQYCRGSSIWCDIKMAMLVLFRVYIFSITVVPVRLQMKKNTILDCAGRKIPLKKNPRRSIPSKEPTKNKLP